MAAKKQEPEQKTVTVEAEKVQQPSPYGGDAFGLAPAPAPLAVLSQPDVFQHGGIQTPEMSLDLARRRIALFQGIVKLIATQVKPHQLFVFAGWKVKTPEDLLPLKAYLPLHVCQSILAWSGAIWMPDREMIERRDNDGLGDFIEYDQWVDVMTADNREVRVMGTCSTRHAFHGLAFTFYGCPACRAPLAYGKSNCPVHGLVKARKLNAYRPLSDVNRGNVRKHAVTNAFNKAVDALGFTPTMQDLKDAGMDITKIPRANFGGRDDEDEPPQGQNQAPQNSQQRQTTAATPAAAASTTKPAQPATTPAAASPAPAQAQPTQARASTPGDTLMGVMEEIIPGMTNPQTKPGEKPRQSQPYLGVIIEGKKLTAFDNKLLPIDTRGNTKAAFDLIKENAGRFAHFRVKETGCGKYLNIIGYIQIGSDEWDESGVLVLRRDAAPQAASTLPKANIPPMRERAEREPGDEEPNPAGITDDDLPAGLWK